MICCSQVQLWTIGYLSNWWSDTETFTCLDILLIILYLIPFPCFESSLLLTFCSNCLYLLQLNKQTNTNHTINNEKSKTSSSTTTTKQPPNPKTKQTLSTKGKQPQTPTCFKGHDLQQKTFIALRIKNIYFISACPYVHQMKAWNVRSKDVITSP